MEDIHLIQTQWSVNRLTESFRKGEIAIPEIQRDVVWKDSQVKDLIESICQNYPCGSLIVWEPRIRDEKLVREMIRPERLEYYNKKYKELGYKKKYAPKYFLIDGQQRVSALASVVLEHGFLKKVEPEIEGELASIHVDLRRFPREIFATTRGVEDNFPYVLLNNVLNGQIKDSPDYTNKLSPEQKHNIESYVQRLRDYQFPIQIIQETDYPTVGKIFALVNSQGTPLTGAEIYIASIIPYWKGITKEFRKYRQDLRDKSYDLDLTFLMRAITVIACDVPQIKKLADKVSSKQLNRTQLSRLWSESKRAIDAVIRILRKDLFLDRTQFFVSKNALVPLVYYAAKSHNKRLDRKAIMKYFLVSQLGEHYSRASETVLRKDLNYFAEGTPARKGLRELLDFAVKEARQEYRALKIKPQHVRGVPSKNVMLLLMYIVMRKRNATDFSTGRADASALNQIPGPKLQLHHIFPFDFMMKDKKAKLYGSDRNRFDSWSDYREEVNDIANITFLSQKKNVQIGNVSPWQYLDNETTPETREAHFIPEDRDLWTPTNFDNFLDQRRKMMAEAMNSLVHSLH